MAKNVVYAVRKGKNPGIYDTWDEAKVQVLGFHGAEYAKFNNLVEASKYMQTDGLSKSDAIDSVVAEPSVRNIGDEKVSAFAFVDGSFNPATRRFGYGGFLYVNGRSYPLIGSSTDPELVDMRNVAGEIYGSMSAVRKAEELGLKSFKMLYDYKGIEKWATGEWRTNKSGTREYAEFMNSPERTVAVEFEHVDAHTGIEGNEKADVMAKYAVGIPLTKSQERLFVEALNQGKRDGIDVVAESGIQSDFSFC